MTQRRTFTAEFKTQVVLDLLSGAHTPAELCRQHQLNAPVLARWKSEFLERASQVFEQDENESQVIFEAMVREQLQQIVAAFIKKYGSPTR
jgi:putative transposase